MNVRCNKTPEKNPLKPDHFNNKFVFWNNGEVNHQYMNENEPAQKNLWTYRIILHKVKLKRSLLFYSLTRVYTAHTHTRFVSGWRFNKKSGHLAPLGSRACPFGHWLVHLQHFLVGGAERHLFTRGKRWISCKQLHVHTGFIWNRTCGNAIT